MPLQNPWRQLLRGRLARRPQGMGLAAGAAQHGRNRCMPTAAMHVHPLQGAAAPTSGSVCTPPSECLLPDSGTPESACGG